MPSLQGSSVTVHLKSISMGVRRGKQWVKEPKISRKPEVSNLFPINWFDSYNDNLFVSMTLLQADCSLLVFIM